MRLRHDAVSVREIDGETIVLDLLGSRYLLVNNSGTALLRELRERRSADHLVEVLIAEFAVDEETATRDVSHFLAELSDLGLLDADGGQ